MQFYDHSQHRSLSAQPLGVVFVKEKEEDKRFSGKK
jgi:hypothetical protein